MNATNDRNHDETQFAGIYRTDDGADVPCTAKPSKRQPGKLMVEYAVIDVLESNMAGIAPQRKRRAVTAIVDAERVTRH